MHPRVRALLREPLVCFVLVGAILFVVDRALHPPLGAKANGPALAASAALSGPSASRPLVVDASIRKGLADRFEASEHRAPTPAELARMVDDHVIEEVLLREGLARGLERDDPTVRARVSSKMASVLSAGIVLAPPTEPEIAAYYEAHRDRWDNPPLLDFVQVFVEGATPGAESRAQQLLKTLEGGADPAGLGDMFSGGRRYRQRSLEDLATAFGPTFVEGLEAVPEGKWVYRVSQFGQHLVRIEKRTKAEHLSLDTVRLRVREELYRERQGKALEAQIKILRDKHPVDMRP